MLELYFSACNYVPLWHVHAVTENHEPHEKMIVKFYSEKTNTVDDERSECSFSCFDQKGREVGIAYGMGECDLVEIPESARGGAGFSFFNLAPGHYFTAWAWATRDGKTFGAIQPRHYFPTRDERDAWLRERIFSARRRAQAKFFPGAPKA